VNLGGEVRPDACFWISSVRRGRGGAPPDLKGGARASRLLASRTRATEPRRPAQPPRPRRGPLLHGQRGAREHGEPDPVGQRRLQDAARPFIRPVQLGQVGVVGRGHEDARSAPPPPGGAPDPLLQIPRDVEVLSPLSQLRPAEGAQEVSCVEAPYPIDVAEEASVGAPHGEVHSPAVREILPGCILRQGRPPNHGT